MATSLKKKNKKKEELQKDFKAEVLKLFAEYKATVNAIVDDYVGMDGMITEMETADENFISDVDDIETDLDFKDILIALEKLDYREIKTDELLNLVEESEVFDWIRAQGYYSIKLETLEQSWKLEDFINTEIYPLLQDQLKNPLL